MKLATISAFGFATSPRPWLDAAVLSLAANALFAALLLCSSFVPQRIIVQRLLNAFAAGDLIERDYLPYDTRRGWHQYNDCNILQMISNPDASSVGRALGPWLYMPGWSALDACRTLRALITHERQPADFVSQRYTRYWHGYIPVVSALLPVFELATVRFLLRASVYASILLLFLAGVWDRRSSPFTFAVAATGGLFWGLPYFGQGMSHAPGDAAVVLGIAEIIFWQRVLARPETMIPYCALFGAVVVFFTMLTGPLPTAGGLLFPAIYLVSRVRNGPGTRLIYHFGLAAAGLLAFALGAIVTVITRLLVAFVFVEPSGIDLFLSNLELYSGSVSTEWPLPSFVQATGRLMKFGAVLAYGSIAGAIALYASSAIAWIAAFRLAWKGRVQASADFAAFLIGASAIVVWCFLLPRHTFMHAEFMARILIVPLSLGWAALHWQLRLRSMRQLQALAVDPMR